MEGETEFHLRRSPRARRLRLVVTPRGIELVLPPGFPESVALDFYARHRPWALNQLGEAKSRREQQKAMLPVIGAEGTLPFQGRALPVQWIETQGPSVRFRFSKDDGYVLEVPQGETPQEELLKRKLFETLRPFLKDIVMGRIKVLGEPFGFKVRSIRVKRVRTRWGSLGPSSDVNLNWLLVFAPPEILDYVVFHELCHTRHRNHSPDFWALVEEGIPDWKLCRVWLREEGSLLLARFG